MNELLTFHNLSALATLIILELILNIDNVIFISVVANRLPDGQRERAWRMGLLLALILRISMLVAISWVMQLNQAVVAVAGTSFSLRDFILIAGGLFLIYKSTIEINRDTETHEHPGIVTRQTSQLTGVVLQIVFIDVVFSFDSILTAIGLSQTVIIMIVAVLISIGLMMVFVESISSFITRNPSAHVLALGFLILIGFVLLLDGFHYGIPKGYLYFAIAFSFTVELLNIRKRRGMRGSPDIPETEAQNDGVSFAEPKSSVSNNKHEPQLVFIEGPANNPD